MREITRLMFNKRFRRTFFMFIGFFIQFWWLGKTKKFFNKEKRNQKYSKIYTSQAIKFTALAVAMGGLLIKLGQFVSSRVDILPKEYTDILSELQDSVAPVEADEIINRIEAERGAKIEKLFSFFTPKPIAAASLGQVHKAVNNNGETVAVKVMRPGIESTVQLDLATLKMLTAFASRFTNVRKLVDLKDVYLEFEEVIQEELDYLKEAANIEKFSSSFREFPGISVPKVYWEETTSKVLVMEFIEGVKINETDKLEGVSVNKQKIASILFLSYLKQLMEDGFFHADPHPGNLLVKKDGTLAYIDFGMVGTVSDQMKAAMFKLAFALYLKDAGGIVAAFDELGFLRKQADRSVLTKNVKVILSGFSEDGFNVNNINNDGFFEELREFLYEQPFQIPSKTTFLGKAIVTVFSLCKGLEPDFDFVQLAKPFIEEMMKDEDVNTGKNTILDQVKNTFFNIIPASRKLFAVIDQLESGEMRMQTSKAFEKKLFEQQTAQTRKIIFAIFGTGILIAGAQVININDVAGISMMAGGALITILQAMGKTNGTKKHRRPHPSFKKNND
jgi:predicted unusual protein kinase regulating ubiquinone biosynthesis (AarF/ABC1/UbiB family)